MEEGLRPAMRVSTLAWVSLRAVFLAIGAPYLPSDWFGIRTLPAPWDPTRVKGRRCTRD